MWRRGCLSFTHSFIIRSDKRRELSARQLPACPAPPFCFGGPDWAAELTGQVEVQLAIRLQCSVHLSNSALRNQLRFARQGSPEIFFSTLIFFARLKIALGNHLAKPPPDAGWGAQHRIEVTLPYNLAAITP